MTRIIAGIPGWRAAERRHKQVTRQFADRPARLVFLTYSAFGRVIVGNSSNHAVLTWDKHRASKAHGLLDYISLSIIKPFQFCVFNIKRLDLSRLSVARCPPQGAGCRRPCAHVGGLQLAVGDFWLPTTRARPTERRN